MHTDIISVHAELTKETKNLISENEIKLMKKNAILINAARAELVNEEALINALKEKRIKMAILDVIEKEQSGLFDLDNAIITPHIAGNSFEAKYESAKLIFAKIINSLN